MQRRSNHRRGVERAVQRAFGAPTPARAERGTSAGPRPAGSYALGQRVRYRDAVGCIVADLDRDEYAGRWATRPAHALSQGVLVEWADGTVTHFREPRGLLVPVD